MGETIQRVPHFRSVAGIYSKKETTLLACRYLTQSLGGSGRLLYENVLSYCTEYGANCLVRLAALPAWGPLAASQQTHPRRGQGRPVVNQTPQAAVTHPSELTPAADRL